jgi:predicted esterase
MKPLHVLFLLLGCLLAPSAMAEVITLTPTPPPPLPQLPATNGPVTVMAQNTAASPVEPLILHIRYPKGKLEAVNAQTGLMLDLHNWGGTTFDGAVSPELLAATYNVIAIGVQYRQSGDDPKSAIPYDFGYGQALDALQGLAYVYRSLQAAKLPFDATRIYGCGGSGGGNVIQMANKFAPHTFACIVDLSGMASLTDDIAYNLPGGSGLNARYSRDPASPAFLAPWMQEIRDLGNPTHLAQQAKSGTSCKIVVIHGEDDGSCLASDKHRVVDAMKAAGLDVEAHFLGKADVDGTLVTNSGHSLGNRTALLQHFAGDYLTPGNPKMCRLTKPDDIARGEAVRYATSAEGEVIVGFGNPLPTLVFVQIVKH